MNHTPLPWKVHQANVGTDAAYKPVSIQPSGILIGIDDGALPVAALIVRAVNNHQKLVDALRDILEGDAEAALEAIRAARVLLAELEANK